ncbi:MAG: NUDIX hydrolase [Thermoleophilia bacterium]|nr:NUDIX hydrolase [Thermoleophilia bacterium]
MSPRRTSVSGAVRAAGGVVAREHDGRLEVLVIHRPRYGDWGFPKGKVEENESEEECAVREVAEETNLRCDLGRELGMIRYTDARGRAKTVRYWTMSAGGDDASPGEGVDEVRWLPPDEAARLLTHERDREILGALDAGASAV